MITNSRCLSELSHLILDIDLRYASSPNPDLYKERLRLQSEFENLSTKQVEQQLLKARKSMYEHGEKQTTSSPAMSSGLPKYNTRN